MVKADTQTTADDLSAALDLFAEIIAHTFAREHGLLTPDSDHTESPATGGAPAAAAEVGSAPLPNAGTPGNMELEYAKPRTTE